MAEQKNTAEKAEQKSAIEKYASEVKAQFTKIDKDIADLQDKSDELTARIETEGGGYSLEATQKTASLRQELSLVDESLGKARAERERMTSILNESIQNGLYNVKQEFVAAKRSENATTVRTIWNLSQRLRRLIWELNKAEQAAHLEYNSSVNELSPYLDEKGKRDLWTYRNSAGTNLIPPYLEFSGHDYDLIRHIQGKINSYNREFSVKEDANNG